VGIFATLFGLTSPPARPRQEPRILAASPENPATSLANPADWLVDWVNGGSASFGPPVSERTAMACSAVYRCVAICSGLIAELPLKIYRRTPDGREEAPKHRLAPLFQVAPYPGRATTAFSWRESWVVHEMLWGNHYSIIRRDGAARVVGFEPVLPWNVEVFRRGGRNLYRCTTWGDSLAAADGPDTPNAEYVAQDDMLHIPGLGFNGVAGVSRIRAFARNAVSLAQLLEEQTGIVHENAAKPSGMVTPGQGRISPEGFARFRAQFTSEHTGRRNAGKVIFADHGAAWQPLQMSPEDLGTIEFRRFQVADISRFFGVPLHLLNETDKSTSWGSGLSEQTLAFLIYTLNPDLGRIEAELNYKLFNGSDHYIEFDRDAMMAMDPVKAATVAQTEIASGVMTINERRRHKNRPPVAHGDEPLINTTNMPLARLFDAPPPQTAPNGASNNGTAPKPNTP
jgi:HK97 family phage portal protein